MPRGILFIAGLGPTPGQLAGILRDGDVICAADSGLDNALAAGIRPVGMVGDMDSISDKELLTGFSQESLEIHPEDKGDTDTEIGIAWLRRRNCDPIVVIGGGEGRLDHTLALVKVFENEYSPQSWYTAREAIFLVQGPLVITGNPGDPLSFYPVGRGPWVVGSRGLRWELDSVDWAGGLMSLSNRFVRSEVELGVKSGRFLLIRPFRGG